jgi:hypothetical protein
VHKETERDIKESGKRVVSDTMFPREETEIFGALNFPKKQLSCPSGKGRLERR